MGKLDSQTEQVIHYIDGLVQKRRNSSALTMELRLSCINPSISSSLIANYDQRTTETKKLFAWNIFSWLVNQ